MFPKISHLFPPFCSEDVPTGFDELNHAEKEIVEEADEMDQEDLPNQIERHMWRWCPFESFSSSK